MHNTVKVLHFIEHVNENDFVDSVINNIDSENISILLCITGEHPYFTLPNYSKTRIKFINLNLPGRKNYLNVIFKLRSIIKEHQINILHCHLFELSFLGAVLKILSPKTTFLFTRHYSDDLFLTSNGLKLKRALFIEWFTNKIANKIISPSQKIYQLLLKNGASANKIATINYTFDFEQPKYKATTTNKNLPSDTFVVGNFARHYFLKNQTNLIWAIEHLIKKNINLRLILCGDGPDSNKLKEMVSKLKLNDFVEFTGWVKSPKEIIEKCDLIVHPTQGEAFPQIMVECMALKKTIAITEVSAATEHIKHWQTGVFLKSKNIKDIANCIEECIIKKHLLPKIGENAHDYVIETLNLATVIPMYETLYLDYQKK